MKKIASITAALLTLLALNCFAASNVTSKNDTQIPCYNGGFSFGLAGYNSKSSQTNTDAGTSSNKENAVSNEVTEMPLQPDYR